MESTATNCSQGINFKAFSHCFNNEMTVFSLSLNESCKAKDAVNYLVRLATSATTSTISN
jgi:hypothetical protein